MNIEETLNEKLPGLFIQDPYWAIFQSQYPEPNLIGRALQLSQMPYF